MKINLPNENEEALETLLLRASPAITRLVAPEPGLAANVQSVLSKHSARHQKRRVRLAQECRRGFTLIEVIVALGILSLLAAILFPVLISARRRAHDSQCATNLHQISSALLMYTADSDHCYPPSVSQSFYHGFVRRVVERDWSELLECYVGRQALPHCPDVDLSGWSDPYLLQSITCGYALNRRLNYIDATGPYTIVSGVSVESIRFPALTVALFDARSGVLANPGPDASVTPAEISRDGVIQGVGSRQDVAARIASQTPGATRHHGGAFYAFVDGHVKWMLPGQLVVLARSDALHFGYGR